jgi:arylsulfatase A-like enzyme
LEWIKNNQDKKFFVHVQGYDTHCPFNKGNSSRYDKDYKGNVNFSNCLWTFGKTEPRIIDGKPYYPVYSPTTEGRASVLLGKEDVNHLIALYDESITQSDAVIGSFLEEIEKLRISDNTIIIFTSEHGDMLGKQGRFMRGGPLRGTFYDDVLHVPFFIKHPKLKPGRVDALVEHVDIMPTLLDFLGIKKPPALDGKSIVPVLAENKEIRQYVFAGSEFHPESNLYFQESSRIEAIRSKEFKLIKETIISTDPPSFDLELYDLKNDKEELYNVAESQTDILNELLLRLNKWSEKMRDGT